MAKKKPRSKKTRDIINSLKNNLPILRPRKKRKPFLILALLVILGFVFYFRGLFVAALVNGKPITRFSVIKELESQGGRQALESLISRTLIRQQAAKDNVSVSNQEIESEVKKIEEQLVQEGQNLDQVLKAQGLTREDVYEQTKIQLLVEKLLVDQIKVTDEEISKYLQENQGTLPKDLGEQELKKQVKEQLKSQKLNNVVPAWLQELHSKANILYFVNY